MLAVTLGPASVSELWSFHQATAELGVEEEDMRLHLRKQEAADLIGSLAEEGEFDAVLSHWHAKSLN